MRRTVKRRRCSEDEGGCEADEKRYGLALNVVGQWL